MWILYQTALALVLAVAGPLLLLRRGRHYLPTLAGRLGSHSGNAVRGPLWVHAVSVGEVRVASILAAALPSEWPLLVSTITPTGQEQAQASLGSRAVITYFPLDLGFAIRRFLSRFEPRAAILVEGDYWPLMMRHLRRRRLPVMVANGRVGDRTFARLRRVPWFARLLYRDVACFAVQTELDRQRLIELGVAAASVVTTGNLKFDAEVPAALPAAERAIAQAAAGRPILIAGSTMPGEEEQVLEAFRAAGGGASALLVIAPRHPERWPEVEARVDSSGFKVGRRSDLDAGEAPAVDVVLLDTLGELAALYRPAVAAFVGGTLVPTGGHNPLEPALHGVPVAVGPSMENFRDTATRFDEADAWHRVDDATGLGGFFARAVAGETEIAATGQRGAELVLANRGATQRTLEVLAPFITEAMA